MTDFFFPRTRRRTTFSQGAIGQSRSSTFGAFVPYNQPGTVFEECIDEIHPWDPRSAATQGDIGGPLQLTRTETTYGSIAKLNTSLCVGTVVAKAYTGYTPNYSGSMISVSSLNAFGTTAIARCLPTNPAAGLSTFLGELRQDGLPHLPGSEARKATSLARGAGSEYLNYQFGWVPFLSDIRKFAFAVKHSKELIDTYRAGSDKKIRRRYNGPGDSTVKLSQGTGFATPSNLNVNTMVYMVETTETNRKFSGAFRYHIPVGNAWYERLARYETYANHIIGSRVTPETLWNIEPWSWAIDWFTNTGDVIHNISSLGLDGLVMQYGYATDYVRWTADAYATTTFGIAGLPVGTKLSRHQETKYIRRVSANPYGFGITDASLSAKQAAILVALGLTRGQRYGYHKP